MGKVKGPIVKKPETKGILDINPPKAWGGGPVRIFDVELECYILEDGTAILSKRKMMKAIGRSWKGDSRLLYPLTLNAK